MGSPVLPSELRALVPTTTMGKCLAFSKAILQFPLRVYQIFNWMLDSAGNPSAAFSSALLFDANKKGWFAASDVTNGELILTKRIPLAGVGGVTQTSGLLVVGKKYIIIHLITGDSFTNVGAGSNEDGVVFTASGTTPTTWTNGSTLQLLADSGDYIIHNGTDWVKRTPFYGAPVTGGPTVPDPATGEMQSAAHGLGATPQNFRVYLECNSADLGYSVGDRVDASSLMFQNTGSGELSAAVSVMANSTSVVAVFRNGGATSSYDLLDKSALTRGDIDRTKWNVKMFAMP